MSSDADNMLSQKPYAVILGATSLVGRYLAERLSVMGYEGLCLSRRTEPVPYILPGGFSWHTVRAEENICIPASATLFSLIPVVALPALLKRITGGNRLIALSSSAFFFKAQSPDPKERKSAFAIARAEKKVELLCQDRKAPWTVFRSTLIYDPGHDRNITAIAAFAKRYKFFPVVYPGKGLRQPIHADDVAQVMVAVSNDARTHNRFFDLPGNETLTYHEMVSRIFRFLGQRPVILYLPLSLARALFYVWQKLTGMQYSNASLERMNQALTLDPEPLQQLLNIRYKRFPPNYEELQSR